MIHEKVYQSPVVKINYAESQDNEPPFLLLHGGSSRWQSFEVIIPDLSKDYHIYAPDLRGHGKSGRVPQSYKIQDYEADLISFIKNVIKKPTIIFGHSLGGMVGVMLAAHYPEMVKALIIGDSPLSFETICNHLHQHREMTIQWRDWARMHSSQLIAQNLKEMLVPVPGKDTPIKAKEIFGENNPWFDFMGECLNQNDPDMLTSIIDDYEATVKEYDVQKLFPKITCPVLILRGSEEQGSLISDEDANNALNLLPHAIQIQISHVGHALFMQDKDAVVKSVLEFLWSQLS